MLQTHATGRHSNGQGNKWQQFPDIWDHVGSISVDNTLADTSANCPHKERPYRIDDLIKCVSRFLEPGLACFSISFHCLYELSRNCSRKLLVRHFWRSTCGNWNFNNLSLTTVHCNQHWVRNRVVFLAGIVEGATSEQTMLQCRVRARFFLSPVSSQRTVNLITRFELARQGVTNYWQQLPTDMWF